MSIEYTGVRSLVDAYNALGLPERKVVELPEDATPEALRQKITNPEIIEKLGIPKKFVKACFHVELQLIFLTFLPKLDI